MTCACDASCGQNLDFLESVQRNFLSTQSSSALPEQYIPFAEAGLLTDETCIKRGKVYGSNTFVSGIVIFELREQMPAKGLGHFGNTEIHTVCSPTIS